jgi:hypothetical protein
LGIRKTRGTDHDLSILTDTEQSRAGLTIPREFLRKPTESSQPTASSWGMEGFGRISGGWFQKTSELNGASDRNTSSTNRAPGRGPNQDDLTMGGRRKSVTESSF